VTADFFGGRHEGLATRRARPATGHRIFMSGTRTRRTKPEPRDAPSDNDRQSPQIVFACPRGDLVGFDDKVFRGSSLARAPRSRPDPPRKLGRPTRLSPCPAAPASMQRASSPDRRHVPCAFDRREEHAAKHFVEHHEGAPISSPQVVMRKLSKGDSDGGFLNRLCLIQGGERRRFA
jgi:hypothetical protein